MLEFGQEISLVALVIVGMIALTSRGETHVATCPGYMAKVPGALFYSVTKSKVELEHSNLDRILVSWH